MNKARSVPLSEIKMPEAADDLDRLADHLVARLRDVRIILADNQPEHEPAERTGS